MIDVNDSYCDEQIMKKLHQTFTFFVHRIQVWGKTEGMNFSTVTSFANEYWNQRKQRRVYGMDKPWYHSYQTVGCNYSSKP